MGNKQAQRRISARRAATFLAALGALVMSSGVALMVAATPANAAANGPAPKVTFCHSTGSESNPWVKITTSANAFYEGHVLAQHTSDVYPAVTFTHGQQTISVPAQGDQSFLENGCQDATQPEEPALDATAAVDVVNPSCDNDNTPDYTISGSHVSWVVDSEDLTPGGHVTVTFTAKPGHAFADESTEKQITENFGPAAEGCQVVTPPTVCPAGSTNAGQTIPAGQTEATFCTSGSVVVSPPQTESQTVVKTPKTKSTKAHAAAVTPTVVEAGLVGSSAQDLRGEQGLALMVAGMVMLVAAGGLGLRVRGAAARS